MDKKLKRQLDLAGIKPINENKINSLSEIDVVKKASNGKSYAIIRENRKYYIKVTDKAENLVESDFDYIGGLSNKPKHSYTSFSDATKGMNFMFEQINSLTGGKGVNILESDEELLGEKKYVLKQKKKAAPTPEPELDFGSDEKGGDEFDFGGEEDAEGGDEFDFGGEEDAEGGDEFDFGGEEDEFADDEDLEDLDDEDDPIKGIQKTTGQLGQKLRDTEDLSSDMIKWVAKSVMSALPLDDMDSSDKKDLIKTIKKKKKEDTEDFGDGEFGGEDEFGGEEMEESYDSYMDDEEFDYEEIPMKDIEMGIKDKAYLNLDPDVLTAKDLYGPKDKYDSYMDDDDDSIEDDEFDYEDIPMRDIDMGIKGKGMLNLDPVWDDSMGDDYEWDISSQNTNDRAENRRLNNRDTRSSAMRQANKDMSSHYNKPSFDELSRGHKLPDDTFDTNVDAEYDSYMDDESACPHCVGSGCSHCAGLGYIDDLEMKDIDMGIQDKAYLNLDPDTIGDEYGNYMEDDSYDEDNPNIGGDEDIDVDDLLFDDYMYEEEEEYTTIEDELGLPPATPESDETDYEHTPMMGESRKKRKTINEDHYNDRMNTEEQLQAYLDVENMASQYGYTVGWCHEDESEDIEEMAVYLDIEDGKEKILKVRINAVGDIEMGHMKGNNFVGEPVDTLTDFDEVLDEDLNEDNMEMNDPAPVKPSKPAPTKDPDTDKPSRPSKRPFTPPPGITPGEEPRPKAGTEELDVEFE